MDKDRILALDTETTGVGPNAEILQLSVIDGEGAVRMNQYFRPKKNSSWPEAEKVEPHLPDQWSAKCPFILDHKEEIQEMLGNAETIVGYNLPFDVQMLLQSGLTLPDPKKPSTSTSCPPSPKNTANAIPSQETSAGRNSSRAPNTTATTEKLARQPRRHESDHLLLLEK